MQLPQRLDDWCAQTILALVEANEPESAQLDFKGRYNFGKNGKGDQANLRLDIVAMANADGGFIVVGVEEVSDEERVLRLASLSDAEQQRKTIADTADTGIEPPHRIDVRVIPMDVGDCVVIQVPRSWSKPHRETDTNKFVLRVDKDNRYMTVSEIRESILRSELAVERITKWLELRREVLEKGMGIHNRAGLVVELDARYPRLYVHMATYESSSARPQPVPNQRVTHNADGWTWTPGNTKAGYTTVFRQLPMAEVAHACKPHIWSEFSLRDQTEVLLKLLNEMSKSWHAEYQGQLLCAISVLDLTLGSGDEKCDRPAIHSPLIVIDGAGDDHRFTPLLDFFWQAFGWAGYQVARA